MPSIKRQSGGLLVFGGIALAVFLIVAFGREYVGNMQIRYEIRQQEKLRTDLEAQRLSTLDLIDSLSNEYYLEKEGRLKQGLVVPGEEVIVVTDSSPEEKETETEFGITALEEVSNAKRWYYYFFDHAKYSYLETL